MGERLKNHLKKMERMLAEWECAEQEAGGAQPPETKLPETQILQMEDRRALLERAKNDLLIQIQFFQHERLIHLIVTALFALLSLLVLIWVTVDFTPESGLLLLLLLVLLVPYIRHYYILENGTQKLYQYYDRLEALLEKIT